MAKKTTEKGKKGKIRVHVSDFAHGLRVFENIQLVRIKSTDYTLLIMEDYFPVLGQVQGLVELVSDSDMISLGRVCGFYIHRDNEFSLLVKEEMGNAPREEPPHEE